MDRPILVTEHNEHGASFVYTDEKHANATLLVDDQRHISRDQQKKAYALLGEIDEWSGNYIPELTKAQMKHQFLLESDTYEPFSLKNCSMSLAREFIDFLIKFCLVWDVPFASKTLDLIQGSYGWELYCLETKHCCICGKHADVAHVHSVGIGRDRKHISHIGNSVMALCREHHQLQHVQGINNFMRLNHLKGVRVTPEIAKMLKLGNWHIEEGEEIISTRK